LANPYNPRDLLAYLDRSPYHATALVWTLNQEEPVYAIQPMGAFAAEVYGRLREFLRAQLEEGVERVSIPGVVGTTTVQLLNGAVVPYLYPEIRAMYSWNTRALVTAAIGETPAETAKAEARETYARKEQAVRGFLERSYFEFRNLGLMPHERALNWAATNAANAGKIFESALRESLELDTITVQRSPVGPPGRDYYDVKLTFFNPSRRMEQARKVYTTTIDVSGIVPVVRGDVRQWHVY
jgi:cyanobactin maturation PatA/PatG family protease